MDTAICSVCGDDVPVEDLVRPFRHSDERICAECNARYTFCDSCGLWVRKSDYVESECCCISCVVDTD